MCPMIGSSMREYAPDNLDSGDPASEPAHPAGLGPAPWPPPPSGSPFVTGGGDTPGSPGRTPSLEPPQSAAAPMMRGHRTHEDVSASAPPPAGRPAPDGGPEGGPEAAALPGLVRPGSQLDDLLRGLTDGSDTNAPTDPLATEVRTRATEGPADAGGSGFAPGAIPPAPLVGGPAGMEFVDEKDLKPRECAFSLAMPDSDDDERRVAGRFPVDQVRCDQGRILDLSRTGLRLERLGRLPSGRPVPVMISDGETVVAIMCEIRWERKLGFMKWSYGLQFHGLTEADMRSITRIAANCREQRKFA